MPIINQTVIAGPTILESGIHSGTLEFEFDDGRKVTCDLRANDAIHWAELLIDTGPQIEAQEIQKDSIEFAEEDQEIVAYKLANREQIALQYLRNAYQIGDPYIAYLRFSRFNDYRISKGWSINQVVTGLSSVGLIEEEWTDMRDRYIYLSQSARVTAMEAYKAVLAGDSWGEDFR